MKEKIETGSDIYYVKVTDNAKKIKKESRPVPHYNFTIHTAQLGEISEFFSNLELYRLENASGHDASAFRDEIAATYEEAVVIAKEKIMECIRCDMAHIKRIQLSIDAYREALSEF